MSKEITIIELNHYNGNLEEVEQMYFETQEGAKKYLTDNGYEPDNIYGWKKDYFETAKIRQVSLHQNQDDE